MTRSCLRNVELYSQHEKLLVIFYFKEDILNISVWMSYVRRQ